MEEATELKGQATMIDEPQLWVGGKDKELWLCLGIGVSAYQGPDLTGRGHPP